MICHIAVELCNYHLWRQ